MNRKGFFGKMIFAAFFLAMLLITAIVWNLPTQHGTSKDIVQGYDSGIVWNHAYLKNDHNTAYCFQNPDFIPILERSQRDNVDIVVTYEKYVLKGALCFADKNYETVVITDVEVR